MDLDFNTCYGDVEKVINRKFHFYFIILLAMFISIGCKKETGSGTTGFIDYIDYNKGVEKLSDEEAIRLVKEIINFMDNEIETGEAVEGFNAGNFAYFKDKEDENILERYHRNYIKDVAYEYLSAMYRIVRFRTGIAKGKPGADIGCIRYRLDIDGDFRVLSRNGNEICIEATFNKDNCLGDCMPKTDRGKIFITLCDDNKWRISKISQWYDDLTFYELEEYIDEFFDTQNNIKEDYEAFINEYGYDKYGNKVSMQMLRYSPKDEILPSSGNVMLEDSDDIYILDNLSKLATHMAYEEIYARHGKIYPVYSIEYNYFNNLSRYEENKEFSEEDLSDTEKHNLKIIQWYLDRF